MIKLVGIDLDGTLLSSNKYVSRRNIDAIKAAIAKGVLVIPNTGRQLVGITKEFLEIDGVDYALTANGAIIWQMKPREIIFKDCFTHEQAIELLHRLRRFDTFISLFSNGLGYFDEQLLEKVKSQMSPEIYEYMKASREGTKDIENILMADKGNAEKFSVVFMNEDERMKAKAYFEGLDYLNVTSSMPNNLELNTASSSKGQGLLWLGERLGIQREEIMAIGDSSNDLSMIKMAGLSVAMANGEDIIKENADYVTDSCENEGVAKAIEKFVLNA